MLIPGFGSTLSGWPLDLLAQLAAGQEVVLVDNRGQGFTQVVLALACAMASSPGGIWVQLKAAGPAGRAVIAFPRVLPPCLPPSLPLAGRTWTPPRS